MRLKMLIIGIKLIQTERPEVKALFLECCMFREHNCWGIQPFKEDPYPNTLFPPTILSGPIISFAFKTFIVLLFTSYKGQ